MPDTITAELEDRKYLVVSSEDLEKILAEAELFNEIDTRLNKTIRLLRYHNRLLFQEYAFDGDIIVRPMESREAADALVQSRLDTYERMWDGCGCNSLRSRWHPNYPLLPGNQVESIRCRDDGKP